MMTHDELRTKLRLKLLDDIAAVMVRNGCPTDVNMSHWLRVKFAELRQTIEAQRDMLEDSRMLVRMLAQDLGVEYEPHQSFEDRLLEAAGRAGRILIGD
jgi:hypothetical protein